jgi:hypothetical protein
MSLEQMQPISGRPMPQHYWVGGARRPDTWNASAYEMDGGRPSIGNSPQWATTGPMTLGLVYPVTPGEGAPHRNLGGGEPLQRISWALRNQNYQPTCIAHAVVAGLELILVASERASVVQPLSARFLYHQMRNKGPGTVFRGARMSEWSQGFTSFEDAKDALRDTGICLQSTWPDSDLLGEKPRQAAYEEAKRFRCETEHYNHRKLEQIRGGIAKFILDKLKAGQPVAIALPAFGEAEGMPNNWNRTSVLLSGHVQDPRPSEGPVEASGHAVCIVGFLPRQGNETDDVFVFRNSLGEDFASLPQPSVLARGYGKISASHVEQYTWELLHIKKAEWKSGAKPGRAS